MGYRAHDNLRQVLEIDVVGEAVWRACIGKEPDKVTPSRKLLFSLHRVSGRVYQGHHCSLDKAAQVGWEQWFISKLVHPSMSFSHVTDRSCFFISCTH